jgi:hypothetical protein
MLNKIACSLNNSAAIGDKGQIYVWGRGKYGLNVSHDLENRVFILSLFFRHKYHFLFFLSLRRLKLKFLI